jgi:hypothetical protein
MPASADIYGQIQPFKAPNPLADMAQVMQIQHAMGANALNDYTLRSTRRKDEETNALASAIKGGLDLSTADGQRQAYGVAPTVADAYINAQVDRQKAQADIGRTTAETGKFKMDTHVKQVELSGQAFGALRANPTPENFASTMDALQQNGIMPAEMVAQIKAKAAADPTSIATMAEQGFRAALSAKDQLAKFETRNTGGTTDTVQIDPVTGKAAVVNSVRNTQSPDSIASNATSVANNKRTIEGEDRRAGVVAGGGMDENSERTAQAIASGQLPAPTGMALLNPKNQRILGRVMEINPSYDATTVDAKKKAARDFTSGPQGNALRSFAVAGDHLAQLDKLVDAMNNGDIQLVNKLGNAYSQQTGNPAVTNFDAAKEIVGKEVVKAIVAGGGGVEERRELSRLLDEAKSPRQLKGVISQFTALMGAQHEALLQQRRAAGLPDSTLPNYTGGQHGQTAAAPTGGISIDQKAIAAELARRGGK